jgi:TolB-like protein
MPEIGQTISHYRITGRLGQGGMGEVFLADDISLHRKVALKFLPPEMQQDATAHKRFLREAHSAAALDHPYICSIHEVGEAGGQIFIVMEYVDGQSVKDRLESGPLPPADALPIAIEVAEALEAAHAKGIIHRDIKPANIMLTQTGHAKVMDFGLAKQLIPSGVMESAAETVTALTSDGSTVGTLAYMSPEQLRSQAVDGRSDIWALGVTLYEMAAGARPFHGRSGFELSSAILNQTPWPLPSRVPVELRAVISRCLEKEPSRRYQQAGEVRAALEAIRAGRAAPWEAWRYRLVRHGWLALMAAILLLAALLMGLNVGGLRERLWDGAPRIRSLAVLPLQDLSGNKEQESFADGMTEELITNLSKIGALRVIARTSVMQYKGVTKGLPQIAKELNVDAMIEGSVLREGGQVRITANLVQASTQQSLWADSYQRDLRSVLALQGEIAGVIADKIRATVTPTERARLASTRPVNPEAYEAYLKGKFYLNKMTPEGFEKGLAYLNQAIEKDPASSLPYSQLALAYAVMGHERFPDAFDRAKAAARKAEELGGEPLAETYLALGMIELYSDWDYADAEKDLRRAIELNASLGEAHRDYSWYLFLARRRRDQALAEMKRAQERDPLTPLLYADRGWQYWWAGQCDKAIEEARKSLELDASFNEGLALLGYVYAEKGMYSDAIAAHEKLAATDHDWRWPLARTYALAGRKDDARRTLARFLGEKTSPTNAFSGWFLAEIYAALGEKDVAFRWLEIAYKERHSFLPFMRDNPAFSPLRGDPRFQDFVRRMNAPE